MEDLKQPVYCSGVRVGNWYETKVLEEEKTEIFLKRMKDGNLLLARFRKMQENLMSPSYLTQTNGPVTFGSRFGLLAPYLYGCQASCSEENKGIMLSGHISETEINHFQDLRDGCGISGSANRNPQQRNTFVVCSADKCNREGQSLTYNQEFMLALSSSIDKTPLYIRYEPDPVPGLTTGYVLYLSQNPVNNCRWRILPKQIPELTRFEQEGLDVKVNKDVVINHCASNLNLYCDTTQWNQGFFGKKCMIKCKTSLDVYKCETPENLWHFYTIIQ